MWMGAHLKAPSQVSVKTVQKPLNEIIQADSAGIIGKKPAQRYKGCLPFLFKLLAATQPLSIQAHPNRIQAKEGFERENAANIPFDAYNRNYRDDNHKPELICALTSFEALYGFRPIPEIAELLRRACGKAIEDALDPIVKNPNKDGLKKFFHRLMTMSQKRVEELTTMAAEYSSKHPNPSDGSTWVKKLNERYPTDIGSLSPLFLNYVKLAPQEALYLPAGVLHSYLNGGRYRIDGKLRQCNPWRSDQKTCRCRRIDESSYVFLW